MTVSAGGGHCQRESARGTEIWLTNVLSPHTGDRLATGLARRECGLKTLACTVRGTPRRREVEPLTTPSQTANMARLAGVPRSAMPCRQHGQQVGLGSLISNLRTR